MTQRNHYKLRPYNLLQAKVAAISHAQALLSITQV